ncbi:MAG TPA: GDP-mannose 4,6-dehydratase [Terracidiphilus sp.]|jgi:GDPmannose 4,6-dehydratase
MKALIYGISGQDGAYLAQYLLELGYEVWGASRDASTTQFGRLKKIDVLDKIKLVSASLGDFRSVLNSLATAKPDEVYNLSGQSSVSLSFEQPVETMESISTGALNLLEAIRFFGKDIKLYNAGSSECFGDTRSQPASEETPFHPRSPYAVAKAAACWITTNYREAYGIFACNGILFNHESPLRSERFVTRKVVRAAARIASGSQEKLQLGNLDIHRDWGWAPEYVRAMWRLMQHPTAEDVVIATGETHSLRSFVECAFEAAGLDWEQHVEHDPTLLRPTDIMTSYADPTKACKILDWKAEVKMHDVVRRMLQDELESERSRRRG